jgi:hypothetical protein
MDEFTKSDEEEAKKREIEELRKEAEGKKAIEAIRDLIKRSTKINDGKSLLSYNLTYDAQTNQIEPVYYWLLDFVQDARFQVEKLTDNFMASPGSGGFDEYGRKLGTMQEKASYYLGAINQVIKAIIQLIYDLKEFEIRLQQYKDASSEDKSKKEAAIFGLKQVWLDNVDMKRGNTGIKAMAFSQSPFALLIDSFMMIKDEKLKDERGNELDLNERVKNVLKQKIVEFNIWKDLSEKELTKRFEIETSYLRTQVQTLKLYTSWARPYLRSAEQLRQKGFETNAAMVNAFSTSMFELTFMGTKKVELGKPFKDQKLKRDYISCILISLTYRGHYSQRVSQKGDMAYGFGGRVDINFEAYSLNSEEVKLFKKLREKQDLAAGLSFVQEETDKSLAQLQSDIDHFLDDNKKEKKESKKKEDDVNPFSALMSIFKGDLFASSKKNDKKDINSIKDIEKDSYVEDYARKEAANGAKSFLYAVYDVYKKAHGMASSPENFDLDEKGD